MRGAGGEGGEEVERGVVIVDCEFGHGGSCRVVVEARLGWSAEG